VCYFFCGRIIRGVGGFFGGGGGGGGTLDGFHSTVYPGDHYIISFDK